MLIGIRADITSAHGSVGDEAPRFTCAPVCGQFGAGFKRDGLADDHEKSVSPTVGERSNPWRDEQGVDFAKLAHLWHHFGITFCVQKCSELSTVVLSAVNNNLLSHRALQCVLRTFTDMPGHGRTGPQADL